MAAETLRLFRHGKIDCDGLTVLVVDDEPAIRELAGLFFEDLGARVLTAEDGLTALDLLAVEPIDLLFTDVRMPGMDGIDLAQEAARRWPRLRIVLTSAYTDRAPDPTLFFLPKPYRSADISRMLLDVRPRGGIAAAASPGEIVD
jgi:CheY-like chemotaxis protein